MNCKKCGAAVSSEDLFCKACGTPVNEVNNMATPETNVNPFAQTTPEVNANPFAQTTPEVNNVPTPDFGTMTNSTPAPEAPVNPAPTMDPFTSAPTNNFGTMNTTPVVEPQPMNNNMGGMQQAPASASTPNKSNNIVTIIAIVVAVACIIGIVILLIPKLTGSEKKTVVNDENNNKPVVVTKSTYKVDYSGFTFSIPDELIYEITNNALFIADEDTTWAAQLQVIDQNYNTLKSNKSNIKTTLSNYGISSTDAEVKTYGDTEYVTVEATSGGENALYAYAKLNTMKVLAITVYSQDNDFDYDVLETISSIVLTAVAKDTSNNISITSKFNLDLGSLSEPSDDTSLSDTTVATEDTTIEDINE